MLLAWVECLSDFCKEVGAEGMSLVTTVGRPQHLVHPRSGGRRILLPIRANLRQTCVVPREPVFLGTVSLHRLVTA